MDNAFIYHMERATNFIPVLCVELPATVFSCEKHYAFVILNLSACQSYLCKPILSCYKVCSNNNK